MDKIKIKCPYCGGENVDGVELINDEIYGTKGISHESYHCYDCDEYFYVFTTLGVIKVEVSKDKWDNYKTIYFKEE